VRKWSARTPLEQPVDRSFPLNGSLRTDP